MKKNELRDIFLLKRKSLSVAEHKSADEMIVKKIISLNVYQKAELIGLYAGDVSEVNLSLLLKQNDGKRFAFPRYNNERKVYEMVEINDFYSDMEVGKYGLLEPCSKLSPISEVEQKSKMLFIVPAVACDITGNRLGRGGGFYDRLLVGNKLPKIAVVYDCQIIEILPVEKHDAKMDVVVSESRIIVGEI